ncbi:HdeD family acid-resistance protein [Novosphingobium rosa]|uniref:HdeD family acid-resistance protein n=1 Tax=Novosphingobium rosa TaxID=76978 RepID=UPI001FDECEEF|nr:DUF308 domain-containing protein [Novosphingobium rosa]
MPKAKGLPMIHTYRPHLRASLGWGWLLAYGLLVMAVGVLALFNPLATGVATGIMLAIGLTLYGVVAIAIALWFLEGGPRWSELLLGALALIAGFTIFDEPLSGAISLIWVIGAWLLVSGLFHVMAAWRLRAHRKSRLLSGGIDVVLGLFLLLAGPASSLFMLTVLVGISFLSRGALLVSAALAIRRLEG